MKISLFSSLEDPFLGLIASNIIKDTKIDSIILDNKKISIKDKKIWKERTNNKIENIDVNKLKIKLIKVRNHNNDLTKKIIKKRKIDLIINCGTPRILNKEIIDSPNIGILNCHPGILPSYRGCSCVEWALFNKDKIGNTCHLMSEKIDVGPIICKKEINITKLKSYQEIRTAVYLDSIKLIKKSIKIIQSGRYSKVMNKQTGKYYKPIDNIKMKKILELFGNELN